MTQIIADATLGSKLQHLTESVEICDGTGQVLGRFTPRLDVSQLDPPISEEELDRREQETESFSTAELLSHLEKR